MKSVAGNKFVGACLFGIVICGDGFFDIFYFFWLFGVVGDGDVGVV